MGSNGAIPKGGCTCLQPHCSPPGGQVAVARDHMMPFFCRRCKSKIMDGRSDRAIREMWADARVKSMTASRGQAAANVCGADRGDVGLEAKLRFPGKQSEFAIVKLLRAVAASCRQQLLHVISDR